ncbi:MAG: Sec-independent protein translocase subunit TatA/TatB [Actinomycetota bacterium]
MPATLGFTIPQGPELIIILGIVVLLFGAKKLPELGSSIGRTITNFKKGVNEGQEEATAEPDDDGPSGEVTSEAPRTESDARDSSS